MAAPHTAPTHNPDAALRVDKSKPCFPLAGIAKDGWTSEDEATATCFCGAVQLAFPTQGPGLVDIFVCHCSDCHKLTASMFASNFTVLNSHLKHLRGRGNLKQWDQNHTIASGNTMTNHFCGSCGSLMYRISSGHPDQSILRIGSIDDFNLMETKLKPRRQQFAKWRLSWVPAVEGLPEAWGGGSAEKPEGL